jgi:hypothetical protein
MSSSDALWLKIWGVVASIGFLIVIIGVVIEGVEHFRKFPKKEHGQQKRIEKFGWFLVVVGLAMEFLGDQAAKRISDREAARLNNEAGDARKDAGEAIKQAGMANELAAKFNADRVLVEKEAAEIRQTNFVLQTKLIELEIKAGHRHLTDAQSKLIENSLQGVGRGTIRFDCLAIGDEETIKYESELTNFFGRLGFSIELGSINNGQRTPQAFPTIFGLWMGVESKTNAPPFAEPIQQAFKSAGILMPGFIDSTATNIVIIRTALKPPY